jgi:hypothetical protein
MTSAVNCKLLIPTQQRLQEWGIPVATHPCKTTTCLKLPDSTGQQDSTVIVQKGKRACNLQTMLLLP